MTQLLPQSCCVAKSPGIRNLRYDENNLNILLLELHQHIRHGEQQLTENSVNVNYK